MPEVTTDATASQPKVPGRRRMSRGLVLVGTAILLVVSAAVGVLTGFGGFVWPDRLLTHPVLFGVAASLLAGYGLAQLTERGWLRSTLPVLGWVVAVLWGLGAGAVHVLFGVEHEVARVESGTLEAVVVEGANGIDPLWRIYVEQADRGPLDRSFYVGCVNGDWQGLEGITWRRCDLLVHSSAGTVIVELDHRGQPQGWRRIADSRDLASTGPIFGNCPR